MLEHVGEAQRFITSDEHAGPVGTKLQWPSLHTVTVRQLRQLHDHFFRRALVGHQATLRCERFADATTRSLPPICPYSMPKVWKKIITLSYLGQRTVLVVNQL